MNPLEHLPKLTMPLDLKAAIKDQTIYKEPWYASAVFRRKWLPALVGLATATGAVWVCHLQERVSRHAPLEIASLPHPYVVQINERRKS